MTPEQRTEVGLRERAYLEGFAEGAATFTGKRPKARTVDRYHADYQLGLEHGRTASFAAGQCMRRKWIAELESGEHP